MSWYLFDLFLNNLNLYFFATILFWVGNYKKRDFVFILFIDVFINEIPIVFISIFILNLFNEWIKKKFVNGFVLNNILFLFNYLTFFLVNYSYKNSGFNLSELLSFYVGNFLINYILFLMFRKSIKIAN